VQHLVAKIPLIIKIGDKLNNKKPSNSLNLLGLFENTGGDENLTCECMALKPFRGI